MTKVKKNISTIFLLPPLGINREELRKNGLINAYTYDSDKEVQYEDCLFVLFKPSDMDYFRNFLEKEYERTTDIIEDYDYPGGYIVVVYKLNPKFKKDVLIVKSGKYSKVSKEYKEMFPKTVTVKNNILSENTTSLQYRIFERSSDLIEFWETKLGCNFSEENELWEGFHIANETLNIKTIIL